jgi:hypothetical protein
MRLNSTVALTLILLSLMFGAGLVSAAFGFAVGHQALKGITQPDVRPGSSSNGKKNQSSKEQVTILREDDILKRVKARMEGKTKDEKKDNKKEEQKQSQASDSFQTVAVNQPADGGFPISVQDQGVKLEVLSARQQGGSLLLNVNLKNDGGQTVRFLYSFLDVTDDKGRALSASADGLPGELPAHSDAVSGTVSIPVAVLDNAEKLSLTLTDYPDQKLQLKMSNIPVVR